MGPIRVGPLREIATNWMSSGRRAPQSHQSLANELRLGNSERRKARICSKGLKLAKTTTRSAQRASSGATVGLSCASCALADPIWAIIHRQHLCAADRPNWSESSRVESSRAELNAALHARDNSNLAQTRTQIRIVGLNINTQSQAASKCLLDPNWSQRRLRRVLKAWAESLACI